MIVFSERKEEKRIDVYIFTERYNVKEELENPFYKAHIEKFEEMGYSVDCVICTEDNVVPLDARRLYDGLYGRRAWFDTVDLHLTSPEAIATMGEVFREQLKKEPYLVQRIAKVICDGEE